MHTHNFFTVFKSFAEANVLPKERRLIFETPENQEQQGRAPQTPRQRNTPEQQTQRETADQIRTLLPQILREPGVLEALNRARGTAEPERAQTQAAQTGGTTSSSAPSRERWFHRLSPLTKTKDNPAVEMLGTTGIIGASVAAGMNASRLADIPVLGKYAQFVGNTLNSMSSGMQSTLTQIGAPQSLSFLANPWVLGLGAPILGLWALGKYRIRTLKSFYKQHPNSPEAQEELAKIEILENRGLVRRQFSTALEGSKLVIGSVFKGLRFIPNALGSITGRTAAFFAGIGKNLGGVKGIINWPFKNLKHLTWGGIGAGAGAAVAAGLSGALAGGTGGSALGPLGVPLGALAGGILAYKRSRRGNTEDSTAGPANA